MLTDWERLFDAPFDVYLSDEDVFQPDIAFAYPMNECDIIHPDGVHGAPDLVSGDAVAKHRTARPYY